MVTAFAYLLARLFLGVIWVVAALAKLTSKQPRSDTVVELGGLSRPLAHFVGRFLPWIELVLGLLLLIGERTFLVSAISAGLLALFTLVIVPHLLRGEQIACNCFGQWGRAKISWLSVVRNGVLCAAAVVVMRDSTQYLSLEGYLSHGSPLTSSPPPVEFIPVLLMMAVCLLLWLLARSTWETLLAMAKAEDGPMEGQLEQQWLRRRLRLREPASVSVTKGE
jgi:uncharacterized membrane protein YphA (DoxX/SURF4 family)